MTQSGRAERESNLPFGKPAFGDEEEAAVQRVLRSGWVGMGPEVMAFEDELARACGSPQVVTVNSCTSALFLALLIHKIGPGDEVICPSMTWCSSANAALYLGATPVFCDIDPQTLSVTPETVAAKLSERTKAVVVVHYGGLAVDVAALRRALPDNVAIIEDAAHAFGARYADGRPVGASGNLVCFSFYANKNLSTGEGGAMALPDERQAEHLRVLRLHGLPTDAWRRFTNPAVSLRRVDVQELGYKMNYTDLQAALGRVQLRRQGEFGARRLEVSQYYCDAFSTRPCGLRFQSGILDPGHARHLFVVLLPPPCRADDRDALMRRLWDKRIGAAIHYRPLHWMTLYGPQDSLPVTEDVADRILTLPISASMTLDDAKDVVEAVFDSL
jgi:perosamine synthetase